MNPVYVDIHIHTSENPNIANDTYDVQTLVKQISNMTHGNSMLLSLTDHNTINKKAYLALREQIPHVLLGAELHIKKYESAPPYHCHIIFNSEITEESIDSINSILDQLYPDKVVTDDTEDVPNIEKISNAFDNYDYILLPHGGQSHRTFDKATAKGHKFDTSMERSIYYNHFEGFTARSNSGVEETLSYFRKLGIDQFTNLITCSDNYNPSIYPSAKSKDAEPFIPTWILSEPTFSGLKLALSEKSRLHYGVLPPEKWGQSIYGVSLDSEKCSIDVTMTPGLNVVIGGSSSGKTLFVDSIVRGVKSDFQGSKYLDFGVDKISITNPSGVVPHYINQNFIISVLQNADLNLGDIELIREVFPEDKDVTQRIRNGLSKLKKLVEDLVDSVVEYEKYQDQLTHISNPAALIITKNVPHSISALVKPSAEEKNKYALSASEYEGYIDTLREIKRVFEKSALDIPYNNEISTISEGLQYIYQLSELSEKILGSIDIAMENETKQIAEDDRENSQKIEQRNRLRECIAGILKALRTFSNTKEELGKFNIGFSTKEINVGGHRLRIQNSFKLTKEVLVEVINKYLKVDRRINSFEALMPETLYKNGFSERPKVNGYQDFSAKIYSEISEKNKRSYRIITSEQRDFDCLSPGWKSAVILDLLLGYTGDVAPLIIDQPEDNLATDYINHGLVEQIKRIKPQKQIVLVSHNATIPMLGDAQNVIICKNENGVIRIKSAPLESSIDGKRVLDSIADITDGGKPSIRKRVKKYDLRKYKEET